MFCINSDTPGDGALNIKTATLTPDPLVVPGDMNLTLTAELLRDVEGPIKVG